MSRSAVYASCHDGESCGLEEWPRALEAFVEVYSHGPTETEIVAREGANRVRRSE